MEKFDFFPLNRALSLSAMDEDSTESKVDDLLRQVQMLVERQREEVSSAREKRLTLDRHRQGQLRSMVWYGILEFNVPLNTV